MLVSLCIISLSSSSLIVDASLEATKRYLDAPEKAVLEEDSSSSEQVNGKPVGEPHSGLVKMAFNLLT